MLEHVSLPDAVAQSLRQRILNNDIRAETRLVEASLAAEFGVSRGTIRDAMRRLQAEGLIQIVPRRYSVVIRMSARDAEDVCYTRYVLEDASVRQGLAQTSLAQTSLAQASRPELPGDLRAELIAELAGALDDMAVAVRANDMNALVASDTRFHRPLARLSGRHRIAQLWSTLDSQMGAVLRSEIERRGASTRGAVQRHRELLEAIMADDGALLRTALRDHYLGGFGSGQDGTAGEL